MLLHQCIPSISGEGKTERNQKVRYFYLHSLAINLRKLKKKKNHQKCEGLICCFLKINYCSWEAWYHSVLIQIPLNMTFIHLFKILMLPTVYGILKSAVIYLMFKWTHILIIFTYRCLISIMWKMDGPYCILFFTSLILFLSLTSFSFCKNRTS